MKISPLYCGVVLLASGFTMAEITTLTWGDIEFINGYDDFAIIHINRKYVRTAKQDFSRPGIPDAAKYLKIVYDTLCEKFGADALVNLPIVTTEDSDTNPADSNSIVTAANNLLVLAGYVGRLSEAGRPGSKESIPTTLLRTNYQRMLVSKAGLKDDPDTRHFLEATQFDSSTYNNYESHTSPEAQYRLYTILKTISIEVPLRKKPSKETKDGRKSFNATPETNHEAAQLIGKVAFPPGTRVRIRIPHGVTGRATPNHTK